MDVFTNHYINMKKVQKSLGHVIKIAQFLLVFSYSEDFWKLIQKAYFENKKMHEIQKIAK